MGGRKREGGGGEKIWLDTSPARSSPHPTTPPFPVVRFLRLGTIFSVVG